MKRIFHKIMGQIKVIRESADQCTSFHRDFLGAHRYTTEGGMCALRGPLHGAGCLTLSAIRGNNLSPSLRYPFMYFAYDEGLKSRPSSSTKSFLKCNHLQKVRWLIGN